jgi:hypothetical protein
MILALFIIFGGLVMVSYAAGFFLLKNYPTNYDLNGIWAGLAPYHQRWPMYLWFVGEFLSCLGVFSITCFAWMLENENENGGGGSSSDNNSYDNNVHINTIVIFYTAFLISACVWMPLAIQGDRFYSLTIFVLFLTSLSAIGLFAESLIIWGVDSVKPWTLFPLVLHTTLFDFVFWCWTWTPTRYTLLQSTQRRFSIVDQYTAGDLSGPLHAPHASGRPLFIIEEEDSRVFNEP